LNFSMLLSHGRAAGHQALIIRGLPRAGVSRRSRLHGDGLRRIRPPAAKYHVPIVVTGFEPLLQGVLMVAATGSQPPK
jgi:hypothetical protein